MAGFSKVVAIIFLMMMLVFATEVVTVAEARICESPSQIFKGLCFSSSNCGNVCHREGFSGGVCRGFRRRCFCTKGCA